MFWIDAPYPGRLATAARPRAHDWLHDEIRRWREAGVDNVVSLLQAHEVQELGLEDEPSACVRAGIDFVAFGIPDRGVPASRTEANRLIERCKKHLCENRNVLIHCRIGIGRSSMIAACVLMALGDSAETAFRRIAAARGLSVPDTEAQRAWPSGF